MQVDSSEGHLKFCVEDVFSLANVARMIEVYSLSSKFRCCVGNSSLY